MAEATDQFTKQSGSDELISLEARHLEERSEKERKLANNVEELATIIPSVSKDAGDKHEIADGLHEAALIAEEQFRNQFELDNTVGEAVPVEPKLKLHRIHWNEKDN